MAAVALKALVGPTLDAVSLLIGGKERSLCFDFAAIVAAERLTGLNLLKAATFSDLSFTQVRGLLYAALLHDDPSLTLDDLDRDCGQDIFFNLLIVQGAIARAWFGSIAEPKADEAQGEDQAQAIATGA